MNRTAYTTKAFTTACFSLLLLLSLSAPDAQARELKLITIDVAPWASEDPETGDYQGAFIEVVKELEARTRYEISVSLTPFARVDREMESGGHDCTILIPRSETVVAKGELVSYHDMGVVPSKKVAASDYADLSSLRISVIRGSAITPRFDSDDQLQKEYDTDYLIALRKLARQRIDAVAGAIPTILYLAEQDGLSHLLGAPLKLTEVPLVFQCSLKSEHLNAMPEINRAIRAMQEDGTMDKIKNDYFF